MAHIFSRGGGVSPEGAYVPQVFNTPRAITASAVPINFKFKKEVEALKSRQSSSEWQPEAWDYYDLIGEIKYAANLIANPLSRINLYVGYIEDSSNVPSKIDQVENLDPDLVRDAQNLLLALETGNGGTSGVLRAAALNLFVVGEFYLVNEPARYGSSSRWQVRSVEEIVVNQGNSAGNSVYLKTRKDAKPQDYIKLPAKGYVARMWRNHPRFSDEADSSMRGILDICDELLLLSRAARASAKSRLNAGILYIPDGISASKEADSEDEDIESEIDSIEEELMNAFLDVVGDDTNGASVAPTILRGPEQFAQSIRHITIERPMDAQSVQRSEKLLDRILASLDIPLDVAKGLSGVKYSNAILIEEQLYKAHIEPLILMIVDSLTIGFLRHCLMQLGWEEEEVRRVCVWYDPSLITAKPSKSEAATTGYEMGIVSSEAWRRYNGFAETDQPGPLEKAQRLAESRGALSEPLTDALVKTMIPEEILKEVRAAQFEASGADGSALQNALGGNPAPAAPPTEQKAPPPDLLDDAVAPADPSEVPAEEGVAPQGLEESEEESLAKPTAEEVLPEEEASTEETPAEEAVEETVPEKPVRKTRKRKNPVQGAPEDLINP